MLTTASGLPVPEDVAEIVDRIKDKVDDLRGLKVEKFEDYLKACDDLSQYLHAKVGAARRELDKDEDRTKLMIDPNGWQRLGERVGELARDYLGAGDDLEDRPLKAFQVDAIEALFEGKDVLLALPCGAGKTGPPAIFGAQRAIEAYEEDQRLCFSVWVVPTTLLCLDKVRDLNERFWRWNEGDDKFAVAVDSRGKKRDALGVVYDEVGGDGTRPKRRHPVLQAVEDREICVGALVLTPEMLAACQAWFCVQARAGHISCFVIDEADDETGVVDSYRGKQARQGKLVRAVVDYAKHERNNQVCVPVVALSGTVAKGDVDRLKADLRLSENAFDLRAAPQRVHVGVEVQISRRPAPDVSLTLRLISGMEERVIDAIHPLISAQADVVISKADYAARGAKKAARAWVGTLPPGAAGLMFAFRKSTIDGVVKDPELKKQGSDHSFFAIHGDVDNATRRERLKAWVEERGVVAVLNEAGHRGVDHPQLEYAVVLEPPSSAASWLQLVGRLARDPRLSGEIVVAVGRDKYAHVASCFREDQRKLAQLLDVIRIFESTKSCWRSVAAVCLGDERSAEDAVARVGCCPACSARREARREGVGKPWIDREVVEVAALLDEVRRAAARFQDQATFTALTKGALCSWGESYSTEARERVVLSLLCDGVLRFDAARLPAQCVRFVVNEAIAAARSRDGSLIHICFARGEVPDDADDVAPAAAGGNGASNAMDDDSEDASSPEIPSGDPVAAFAPGLTQGLTSM